MQTVKYVYGGSATRKLTISGRSSVIISGDSGATQFVFKFPDVYKDWTKYIEWDYNVISNSTVTNPRYRLDNDTFNVPFEITVPNAGKTVSFVIILTNPATQDQETSLPSPVYIARGVTLPAGPGAAPTVDLITQLSNRAFTDAQFSVAYDVYSDASRPVITFNSIADASGTQFTLMLDRVPYLDENGKLPADFFSDAQQVNVYTASSKDQLTGLEDANEGDLAIITKGTGAGDIYLCVLESKVPGYESSSSDGCDCNDKTELLDWVPIYSESRLASAETRLSSVETKVIKAEKNISDLQTTVEDHETRIKANEDAISKIDLTYIDKAIAEEKEAREKADSELDTNKADKTDVESKYSELKSADSTLTSSIDKLSDTVDEKEAALKNSIEEVKDDLKEESNQRISQDSVHETQITNLKETINKVDSDRTASYTELRNLIDTESNVRSGQVGALNERWKTLNATGTRLITTDEIDKLRHLADNADGTYATQTDLDKIKDELDIEISTIPKFKVEVVDALPDPATTEDILSTIYLVPDPDGISDTYVEYIYSSTKKDWERIGTVKADLADYYTKAQIDAIKATLQEQESKDKADSDAKIVELTQVVSDNKTATDNSIAGLTQVVSDNKTVSDKSISELAQTVSDNKSATDSAISELRQVVSDNKTASDSSISELKQLISDETSARTASDATIQENIDKKQDKLVQGDNITIVDNVISATAKPLEPATATTLGGVKVGDGLSVAEDGTLSTAVKEVTWSALTGDVHTATDLVTNSILSWSSSITYNAGQMVIAEGSIYTALKSSTNVNPVANVADESIADEDKSWQVIKGGSGGAVTVPAYHTTVGDGTTTVFTVNHGLNSENLFYALKRADGYYMDASVRAVDANSVEVSFTTAPTADNQVTVILSPGASGISASSSNWTGIAYAIGTASTEWSIDLTSVANRPDRRLIVQTLDADGVVMDGYVSWADNDHVTIGFNSEQQGTALLI